MGDIIWVKGLDHEESIKKREEAFVKAYMDMIDIKAFLWMNIQAQIDKANGETK